MKKNLLILVAITILAAILRFWQLGKIPPSLSDDEVRLVYNAYSLWMTGRDLNGIFLPLAFVVDGYAFNPIPIYLSSLVVGLAGLGMFTARFLFALGGVITVILLYFITLKLTRNKTIAIFSSLTLAFSAWHLQLSRFAYEGSLALSLYILGVAVFLLAKRNHLWLTFGAMATFFLAFYSYSGTKLIFLPVIAVLVWYKFHELNFKQWLMIGLLSFFSFASFFYLTKTQSAAQYGARQVFFQDIPKAAEAVELERRASSSPEFLKRLYHNKLTYWSKIFFEHYQYAFSPQYLFTSQEGSGIFSIWLRGQMYVVEAPFLLLGLLYLFQKRRRELALIILFLLIAPLPSGLGPEPITYTIRSSFMLPWLYILVGAGIYSLADFIKNYKLKFSLYTFTVLAYLYLIAGYLNQYYLEWPRYGAKFYAKVSQDLSLLILKEKGNKNQVVIDGVYPMTFLHYAFYAKLHPSLTQRLYKEHPIEIDNITFRESCLDLKKEDPRKKIPKNSLYIFSAGCSGIEWSLDARKPDLVIKSPDGLKEWLVFEN